MLKLNTFKSILLFLLTVLLIACIGCKVQQMNSEETLPSGEFKHEKVDTHLIPDELPEFSGGPKGLNRFLANNMHYPKEMAVQKISGKVFVNFVIKADGSIINIKVIRGVHEMLDKEAMRVVSIMPRWKPGYLNGKPVNTNFTLPINFILR